MRAITVFIFSILFSINLFAQDVPILDPSLKWNIGVHCLDEGPYNPYDYWKTSFQKIGGDTVVNGMNYKKLVSCSDSLCYKKTLKALIRENSGKIYLANPTKEFVLYDFNLKKGDNMLMSFFNTDHQYFIRVDSVKILSLIDKKNRKFQYVSVFDYYEGKMGSASRNDVFVEGIGSLNFGLDYPWWFFVTGSSGCFQSLLCCYSGENLLYSNPKYNKCYLSTGVHQLLQQPRLVQVATTNHMLEIQLAEAKSGKLFVFDLNGKQIFRQAVNRSGIQFCLPSFGIYLYRFESDKGEVQTGKVLVK